VAVGGRGCLLHGGRSTQSLAGVLAELRRLAAAGRGFLLRGRRSTQSFAGGAGARGRRSPAVAFCVAGAQVDLNDCKKYFAAP